MTARTIALGLLFAVAAPMPAQDKGSRLTTEAMKKLKDGIGKMTAEEAMKLVPGPVSMKADAASVMIPGGNADYVLLWDEARRARVTFAAGKVTAIEASFPDAAPKDGLLTPELAARVKLGMAKDEAMKLFKADKGSFPGSHSTKSLNKGSVEEFAQGRWIKVIIKDGKVVDVQYYL